MREDQNYNLITGINRMLEDIEEFLSPVIIRCYPLLRFISIINIGLIITAFVGLLFYLIFIRHHRIVSKLRNPVNYFAAGILLIIYAILTESPLRIGSEISLNLGLVVMPLAAKLFGPVLAGAFGIIQYATSFVMHQGEVFNLGSMLVAGISGMLYGRIMYQRRTTYLRCLRAKLLVNIVCNIMLVPMYREESLSADVLASGVQSISNNIFLAPVQALLIFSALFIMKKIRKEISQISWGLAE